MNKYNFNYKFNKSKIKALNIQLSELNIIVYKSLLKDININNKLKILINNRKKFNKYNINKLKNICIKSGNNRSVYTYFKQNRSSVKINFSNNLINGLRKSSW